MVFGGRGEANGTIEILKVRPPFRIKGPVSRDLSIIVFFICTASTMQLLMPASYEYEKVTTFTAELGL